MNPEIEILNKAIDAVSTDALIAVGEASEIIVDTWDILFGLTGYGFVFVFFVALFYWLLIWGAVEIFDFMKRLTE